MHSARARPCGEARRSILLAAAGVGALWFASAAVAQHTKLELVRLCDVPPGPVRAAQLTLGEKHKGLAGKRARLVEEIGNYSKGKCGQRMPSKSALAQECRAIIEGFGTKVAELNGEITAFCRTAEVGPWADLLNMRPSAETLNDQRARRNRDKVAFEVQRLENSSGAHVNFDTYAVEITGLPTKGPATPELLLAHIRQNLNSFFDHSASTFVSRTTGDATDWAGGGPAPLGSLMVFKIPAGGSLPGAGCRGHQRLIADDVGFQSGEDWPFVSRRTPGVGQPRIRHTLRGRGKISDLYASCRPPHGQDLSDGEHCFQGCRQVVAELAGAGRRLRQGQWR